MSVKTLEIDGKEYVATYTGATARLYRNRFHEDLLKSINEKQKLFVVKLIEYSNAGIELDESEVTAILIDTIGAEILEKITWAVIATTNKIKGLSYMDYEQFMDRIDDYPSFIGVCVYVYEMIAYANQPTVEYVDKEKNDKKKVDTTEMTTQA